MGRDKEKQKARERARKRPERLAGAAKHHKRPERCKGGSQFKSRAKPKPAPAPAGPASLIEDESLQLLTDAAASLLPARAAPPPATLCQEPLTAADLPLPVAAAAPPVDSRPWTLAVPSARQLHSRRMQEREAELEATYQRKLALLQQRERAVAATEQRLRTSRPGTRGQSLVRCGL